MIHCFFFLVLCDCTLNIFGFWTFVSDKTSNLVLGNSFGHFLAFFPDISCTKASY